MDTQKNFKQTHLFIRNIIPPSSFFTPLPYFFCTFLPFTYHLYRSKHTLYSSEKEYYKVYGVVVVVVVKCENFIKEAL